MDMEKEYRGKRPPKGNDWGRAWSYRRLTSGVVSSASGGPSVDVDRTGGPPVMDVGAVDVEFVRETVTVKDEPSGPPEDLTGDDASPPGVTAPSREVKAEVGSGDVRASSVERIRG